MAEFKNTTIDDTGAITLPVGDTLSRPSNPELGMIRFNTDNDVVEFYNGINWATFGGTGTLSSIFYAGSTFKFMGEEESSILTNTIPSNALAGDFAVAMFATDLDERSQTTPAGWTLIGFGVADENPRSYLYGKILGEGEAGSTVSVTASASDSYASSISIFRGNISISSFSALNFVNVKGPATYSTTISSSGVNSPTVAIATLTGRTGPQLPTLTMTPSDAIIVNGGGLPGTGAPSVGYKIYNSGTTPQDISISVDDTGRQSLSGFYVELR